MTEREARPVVEREVARPVAMELEAGETIE
jgi:hypothetical protein